MIDISDNNEFFDDLNSESEVALNYEWKNIINEWIEMVEDEENEQILNVENAENLEQHINYITNLKQIQCKEHPLFNNNAKWKLNDIFDFENLQPPTYLTLLNSKFFIFIFNFYLI